MATLNWQALIQSEGFSNVMRLVHLAVRMDSVNEDAYRAELVRARRRAYEDALTELAKEAGCDRTGLLTEGPFLTELNEASQRDATSIVNTYNYEVGLAIIAIKEEMPTANRHTYARRLRAWEQNRAGWKDAQIAANTTLSARQKAQQDFININRADGTVELIGPDPAAEPVCQAALDMGRVPLEVANQITMPAHPNCVHTWSSYKLDELPANECDELWMGSS